MTTVADQSTQQQHDVTSIDSLQRVLDRWRGRIDRLPVQADLASTETSAALRRAVQAADHAWVAAARKVREMPRDAGSELGSLPSGVGRALDDLRQACQFAEASVRRSWTGK
jgi:hypothetical protein